MSDQKSAARIRRIALVAVLAVWGIIYCSRMTASGLGYDESVEYYFSKYMTGEVPLGFGTKNMYERIVFTYQPPLYNILMHVWLMIRDTEAWFRLAGVLVTLFGAIGIYRAVRALADGIWPALGAAMYLGTAAVGYYALECGEYHLLLAALAWLCDAFIRELQQKNRRGLAAFFLWATAAAYSQYGAVFIIVPMFVVLAIDISRSRDRSRRRDLIIAVILEGICAVLPLVRFFLLPQLAHQGSAAVSHAPVLAHGSLIRDFFASLWQQFTWNYRTGGPSGRALALYLALPVGLAVLAVAAAVRSRGIQGQITLALVGSWLIYYAAVATSFYGYNPYLSTMGTENMGNRYGLFFIPLLTVVLVTGAAAMIRGRIPQTLTVVLLVVCLIPEVSAFRQNWVKDNTREAVEVWYDNQSWKETTALHQWSESLFWYYLTHDERYRSGYQENIRILGSMYIDSGDAHKTEDGLKKEDILNQETFLYLYSGKKSAINRTLQEVLEDHGYQSKVVYEGNVTMLRETRVER